MVPMRGLRQLAPPLVTERVSLPPPVPLARVTVAPVRVLLACGAPAQMLLACSGLEYPTVTVSYRPGLPVLLPEPLAVVSEVGYTGGGTSAAVLSLPLVTTRESAQAGPLRAQAASSTTRTISARTAWVTASPPARRR